MRLDKYLKVSRLIKRRTVANEAGCTGDGKKGSGKRSFPVYLKQENHIISYKPNENGGFIWRI